MIIPPVSLEELYGVNFDVTPENFPAIGEFTAIASGRILVIQLDKTKRERAMLHPRFQSLKVYIVSHGLVAKEKLVDFLDGFTYLWILDLPILWNEFQIAVAPVANTGDEGPVGKFVSVVQ